MITHALVNALGEPTHVPADLSDWTGRHSLACLALEAATDTASRAFSGLFDADPAGLARAKTLLALLTYCYAAGIYASDEIESRMSEDPMVRYLAGPARPDWIRLRAFRRHWHGVIRESLTRVLTLAWIAWRRNMNVQVFDSEALSEPVRNCGEARDHSCFAPEVERRISRAILLDSMFADE